MVAKEAVFIVQWYMCLCFFDFFKHFNIFFSNIFEFFFDFLETSTVDPYDEPRPLLVKHQQFS